MKARFKVEVSGSDEEGNWSGAGFDQAQYLISANPGEPLGPVEEIASGGELSRVMLALKTTIEAGGASRSKHNGARSAAAQRTLVFDEIDTGIGGRAAEAVGKKLKQLGAHQAGTVRHPPATNRVVCRPALPDREARVGRQDEDIGAVAGCRGSHPGGGADDERRQADRHIVEARRANVERESVVSCQLSVVSKQ